MSDPITASVQIGVAAVRAGVAIAQWWDSRPKSKPSEAENSTTTRFYRQSINDILLVLATLGQRLILLDVVDYSVLPAARAAAREAFEIGDDDEDDMIGIEFDKAGDAVQYAVTCAMVFCAECWPMNMWQGFGCGLFNCMNWADPQNCNIFCAQTDNAVAALKSKSREWELLTKSPSKISEEVPDYNEYDKDTVKKSKAIFKDVIAEYTKRGFPQPLPPLQHIQIKYWSLPFATWGGAVMYQDLGHVYEPLCHFQCDPGRFLYAWTAGKRADLRPGEALMFANNHIGSLADWLEGLNGMTFKVLRDDELDHSQLKLKSSTKKTFKKICGNELGIDGRPIVMVRDPDPQVMRISQQFQKLDIASPRHSSVSSIPLSPPLVDGKIPPPVYTSSPVSPVSPATPMSPITPTSTGSPPVKRRPLPSPPLSVLRTVTAKHDFSPYTEEELGFGAGDCLEIIDDSSEDGWWKARVSGGSGKIGFIPSTYV